ncbi:hypothetical protein DSO57_1037597 [Entomophthora muscae]|uniref:Uncharacterized protein n=1 Tax=Entomophthora muscae TaxID=34485 RepID=A0ACC2SC09_9FUNG|nr:hypothetical protein DSO57_1037597 [Entomophthora muscae]
MLKHGLRLARKELLTPFKRTPSSLLLRTKSTKPTGDYDVEPMLPPDYPIIAKDHHQFRNPWIYDDQQSRRDFDEPVHEQDEVLNVWAPDVHKYPLKSALFELGVVATIVASIAYVYSFNAPQLQAVRRSYPFDGLRVELGNDPNSKVNDGIVARCPDPDE